MMLIAVRDGFPNPFDEAGLTELRLQGLSEKAAGQATGFSCSWP